MISGSNKQKTSNFEVVKRSIDLIGSVFLLIIFSPVMLITAILIKITSPGPILVEKGNKHMMRVGKKGKIFRLYKFRSMMVKADVLEKTDPRFRHVYIEKRTRGNYKPLNDNRVTKLGRIIRKFSIDETPQLMNVLKGEMSIVGPRPYLPDELVEQMRKFPGTEKYVKEVHTVKPGITGFWQVTGRSEVKFDKRIEMDAYYAKKRSILFDILILSKTPLAMISGKGTV
jgi:lipopolysaccharide/colanic/teichoic acid biosynthesis glycosyltransferase